MKQAKKTKNQAMGNLPSKTKSSTAVHNSTVEARRTMPGVVSEAAEHIHNAKQNKMNNEDKTNKEVMVANIEVVTAKMPNPYEKCMTKEAMPIDMDHPIRFITRNWPRNADLTQEQWNELRPRIVKMLQQECDTRTDYQHYFILFGPNENDIFVNVQDAIKALDHQVDMNGKDRHNTNLPYPVKKHIYALQWAFRQLMMTNEVLESRIKKIIGAALTCLIQPAKMIGQLPPKGHSEPSLGVAVIKFPKEEGNKILTECMKSYRVLDEVSCWDINGFEMHDNNLWKMVEGRNYLACCAMIDMQVDPWLEKAKKHLSDIGLADVEGVLLGEADIISRSKLLNGEGEGVVSQYINAIVSKLPLAVNNDDMEGKDVGFATAGGKVLAKLAPMMFALAQSVKSGCAWQLIGGEYQSVWTTVGHNVPITPVPVDKALIMLKKLGICSSTLVPFMVSKRQMKEMARYKKRRRRVIEDSEDIRPIDEEEEEY